ncbi:aspartyl protease family protein [Methylosinus sp. H3A]|uniref:aspartyl protease family protein n=1 Tax=Methylosinus sp. H3A TaxID=2785786 RepID=UPI0018C1F606|nr:aspartyl protease family protein [Methylosinus sp. H3A]MBG0810757.1 aspartyl protease family protein [Methylosinus sp. H3A]
MTKILSRFPLFLLSALAGAWPAQAQERSVVPLTVIHGADGGGRAYVTMRFGNVMGPMRLDTAASTSRIKLAPWNEAFPAQGASVSTGASGAATSCEDVEATNVELKAAQGNNIGRAKYRVTRCATSDGDDLLGLDFFKGARFSLDLAGGEMVFFPQSEGDDGFRPFRRLWADQKLVGLDVRLGKTGAVGLFDTGAEISAVDRRFLERHKGLFTPVKKKVKVSEASGKQFASKVYKAKEIDLGEGRILKDVVVVSYDFGPLREALGGEAPIILGFDILSRFRWDLDFGAEGPRWKASAK